MARKPPAINSFWLHKEKIYKVKSTSTATDQVILEDIADGKLYEVRFALFFYAYEQVIKIGDVCKILGRRPRSIYRYEERGRINKPFCYSEKGYRMVRFYRKQDVLEIHELIKEIHQGRPNKKGRIINNSLPDEGNLKIQLKEWYDNG